MEKRLGAVRAIGTWALLFFATLIAYLPALRGGLLWDDDHHITTPDLQSLHGLWRIWFDPGATQQYYPLLHSAFWIEHRIWGDSVLGYHLANVLLHATAAFLLIAILRRLSLPGAWLAGFMFALHPICVEAVAWISEQKSTLSGVLYLCSALAWLHFDQTRSKRKYFLATGLFVLALLSKTVTATLPAALLVVLWWKRGRVDWRRDARPLLPWLALGACAGIFTAWMERTSIGAQGPDFALTLAARFLLAGRAICFYAGKLLWPAGLMFTYPRWTFDTREWWQYGFPALVVAVAIALALAARRHRGPLAGFLFFAGTLFPVLGFLNVYPFLFSFVADHFQYLACLGIIVPAACGLAMAARRVWPGPSPLPRICAAAALSAVLGVLTWRQSVMYRDAETLYRTTLARNPASWMARQNLCAMLLRRPGGLAEAIAQCEAALRIRPDYAEAHNNLGSAWAQMPDRLADAIAEFRAALAAKPEFAEAHFNLANALARIPGRQLEAIAQYGAALRIRPAYLEAHMNLGTVLSRMPGRMEDAIAEYREALRLDPNLAEAHNNLGSALAQLPGRLADAIAEYRAALEIDPQYAKAHNNLGSLLAEMPGRLPDAIGEYQAAVRANPAYADAHYNLGVALAKAGRTPEAIGEFETVLRLEPNSAKAHYNLGVLLSRTAGRLPEALAHFDAALRISPDPELRRMVDRLRAAQR
ncbi:Tetratricopeptide TPR_2 repeat protein [Candidatus Sulfopaludibacter sp. SbA4]|nr:Tetratricopeptide TPR_2 repeat protein [Candidatus Sulfopaludibacter sp. SbA4]